MKVRFGEIPDGGLRFEINDESWFPDSEVKRSGPVRSVVLLKRTSQDRVILTGEFEATVVLGCDRCTEDYTLELKNDFKLDLEYGPDIEQGPSEHEISISEMDVVYLKEPVIDIYEILGQQVLLMLPAKHLCSESCRGLCSQCGANLNQEKCECKKDLSSSPFAVLKK